ncbi:MAG: DUF4153 domain-containing protein, partial [Clostridia bacterium]|nr:DUF4153 domain-containing protein [Clostridia bacterium]
MKLKERIALFSEKAKVSFGRFPVAFANVAVFFLLLMFSAWTEEINDITAKLIILSACSGVFSAVSALFAESGTVKYGHIKEIMIIASVLLEAVLFVLSLVLKDEVYVRVTLGILFAFVVLGVYFIARKGKELTHTAHTVKNVAFSFFVGLVLLVGFLICFFAFTTLVYDNYSFTDKILYTILIVCATVVPALILIFIPAKDAPDTVPGKGYKGVTVYAGLSIYFLLTAILYMYMVRILVSFELPSGGINPFVTIASAAYIFLVFALGAYERDSAYVRFFMKFGGYFMIPLVIIQCTALGIRLMHYGLTAARFASICFIVVTVLFILGSIFRNKIGLGIPCVAASVIILAVTITPFNIISIPLWNQACILENALTESGMMKDGVIDLEVEISDEYHEKISGAYRYILDYSDKLPEYLKSDPVLLDSFDENFGWYNRYENNIIKYCSYHNEDFGFELTDISEY